MMRLEGPANATRASAVLDLLAAALAAGTQMAPPKRPLAAPVTSSGRGDVGQPESTSPNTHQFMPSLRDTLKAATAVDHAALEATGVLQAFTSTDATPAVYVDYLARQWRLHRLIEPILRGLLDPAWAETRLIKSQWLEDDLATLGVRVLPCRIAWDAACSAPQALGAMYVLEGATLGIRQSVRALPAAHLAHGPANRFVRGYGEHTGALWNDLVTHLGGVAPALWPDVVTGARAVFRAFETHFSDSPHAEINACQQG